MKRVINLARSILKGRLIKAFLLRATELGSSISLFNLIAVLHLHVSFPGLIAVLHLRVSFLGLITVLYLSVFWRSLVLRAHFSDVGNVHSGWLFLLQVFIHLQLLLELFLLYDKLDIFVSAHASEVCSSVSVGTCQYPRSIRDFLHVQQSVWLELIFSLCVLVLLVEELLVIFSGIHKSYILLQLLFK